MTGQPTITICLYQPSREEIAETRAAQWRALVKELSCPLCGGVLDVGKWMAATCHRHMQLRCICNQLNHISAMRLILNMLIGKGRRSGHKLMAEEANGGKVGYRSVGSAAWENAVRAMEEDR